MLKGFKDFLMRGNVVDLAVAVVIGTAFTAIVTSVTEHLIQPMIAAIGGANVTGLAAVITAMVNFLIVAAVVYFLLVFPMKKLEELRKRGQEPGPHQPTDTELLTEIRDLLRQQQAANPQNPAPHQQATVQQGPPAQAQYYPPQPQYPHQQQPPQHQRPTQPPRGPGHGQSGPTY